MNKLNLALVFFIWLNIGFLQAQSETDSVDRFSYGYGVLLGKSMKSQGIDAKDLKLEDMIKALKAVLNNEPILMSPQEAQNEYQNKITNLQNIKSEAALNLEKAFFAENGKKPGVIETPTGIQYQIIKTGQGAKPLADSKVTTHYHGTLLDGTIFDSSVDRGEPISFALGGVIKGWQEVLQLMPVGSKWKVFIPSKLGYGSRPSGRIPANSTLVFEIELISIDN
ncbi:MAG: FKBP-type peptidyl-prolyl cis-trans isomerase [Microscillaceae bacterium]|nr:FKBP-type peptidyl-prolyl cis-trans isomerase [Microscillaceae bacterium]